jgi:hypothetical protein
VFGPVAAIIEAADERDAIAIANASEFGLGSGVLTSDLARGERIAAEELDAGMSFVNDNVRSTRACRSAASSTRASAASARLRHPRVRQRQVGAGEGLAPTAGAILPVMKRVVLPCGESVPALGQGTWNVGDDPARRQDEIAALRAASTSA